MKAKFIIYYTEGFTKDDKDILSYTQVLPIPIQYAELSVKILK